MTSDLRCYVHVGTHKTGTTSIQAMLARNPLEFARAGVLVPRSGRPNLGFAGHHNLAWELIGDPRYQPNFGTLFDVQREIASSGAATICISSEDFIFLAAGTLSPNVLVDAIAEVGYRTVFIVYVRPQADYCRSLAVEFGRAGMATTPDEIAESALATGTFGTQPHLVTFDYEALIARLGDAAGDDGLIVRAFPPPGDDKDALLREFSDLVTSPLRVPFSLIERPPRLNASSALPEISAHATARLIERFGPGNARIAERFNLTLPAG